MSDALRPAGKGLRAIASIKSPIARGLALGATAGLLLSAIYGAGVLGFLVLLMTLRAPGTPLSDYIIQLSMASVTATCAIPCIGLLGVVPGTVWGAILGLLNAVSVRQLRSVLSTFTATLVGVVISGAMAFCLHLALPFPRTTPTEVRTYLLYQGVPSLISLAVGGWMGRWLHRSFQE